MKGKSKTPAKSGWLSDLLSDRFGDIWNLISETSIFLSRAGELHHYENQLRALRYKTQHTSKNDTNAMASIRAEITEIRKILRLQGYDLSLAKHSLVFDGFRHDDSLGLGFRRVVLFITNLGIFTLTGDENHITLGDFLDNQINKSQDVVNIRSRHYLWYRRDRTNLILSGADTETKEDYEHLKAAADVNPLFFLGGLKNLK
jgi:hypothetical protein